MGINKTNSAKQITEVFCKNIYKLHDFPKIIINDKDAKFTSNFWKEFCKQIGITLNMSSAYHPQTDGQTEVVNKCVESYLHSFVIDKDNTCLQWLHLAKSWYNSTYHMSSKMILFQVFNGYAPPIWKELIQGDAKVPEIKIQLKENPRVM